MAVNIQSNILAPSPARVAENDFDDANSALKIAISSSVFDTKAESSLEQVASKIDPSSKLEAAFQGYVSSNDGEEIPSSDDETFSDRSSMEGAAVGHTLQLSEWSKDQENVITAPFEYVSALPQGDFRRKLLDATNVWFQVDSSSAGVIAETVAMLHNASLL
jgi:hypothetical protein